MFGITIRTSGDAQSLLATGGPRVGVRARAVNSKSKLHPHLTLARYEEIDRALLIAGLKVFQHILPVKLVFDCICAFDTEPLVLWLNPHPNAELVDTQAR